MSWSRWTMIPLTVAALAVACGPKSEGDGGDDGNATTTATSSNDDGSPSSSGSGGADSTTGAPACPPNSVYAVPGCGVDESPGVVPVPEAGCYEVCDNGDSSACSEGSCINAWIDPCYGQPCGACGGEQWLCVAGDPLAPGFEADLMVIGGCGSTAFGVYAANEAGDILLTASIMGTIVETAQTTGMTQQEVFDLAAGGVMVWAWTGPQVDSMACNDAPSGTILRSYQGIAGSVDVTYEPVPMAMGFGDQGVATVVLTDVQLQETGGAGDVVTIGTYTFDMVSIWCCPG